MGIGPIPRSAIRAYADEFAITGDAFEQFERIIRAVDAEWLSRVNSLKDKGKPEKGTSAPVDDVEGTKAVMMRLAQRHNANKRKH